MLRPTVSRDEAIDLHVHTVHSDGRWHPVELFDHLAGAGFRVVAVTDHDRVDHVADMQALGTARGIAVIAGVEVTTEWRGLNAHVLCYASRFEGDALASLVRRTERHQLQNTYEVYEELERRGFRFPRRNEVLWEREGQLVRPIDNATLLLEHGYAPDLERALAMIQEAGYRQIVAPIDAAVAAAHASGAVALIAHPGRGGGEIRQYDPPVLEEMLSSVALDGIEVYYPTHTPEQVAAYALLASRRGLLVGAGSDSHGPRQRLPVAYPASGCADLLSRCGVDVQPPHEW